MASYHSQEQTLAQLPEPGSGEIAHSQRLVDYLVSEIEHNNGVISFRDYMECVLYRPGMGYYSSGLTKLGAGGDFVTAPEISDLFGRCLAKQFDSVIDQAGVPRLLEFGAGSGRLCEQIVMRLGRPCDYAILELSADLRQRQQDYLRAGLPAEIFESIRWLDALPSEFEGIVFGNELLDAMPVHLLSKDQGWRELGVGFDGRGFEWRNYADDSEAVSAMQQIEMAQGPLPNGYTTEVNLNYRPWLKALYQSCSRALVLLIDYGYQQSDYYHPERNQGTLICHYQHRSHGDPLAYPGLQDISASVDFDALADAAEDVGFELYGLSNQGQFLLAAGLLEEAETGQLDAIDQLKIAQQIKTLTLPSEMGERFKVIAVQKNLDVEMTAFDSRV